MQLQSLEKHLCPEDQCPSQARSVHPDKVLSLNDLENVAVWVAIRQR